MTTLQSHLGARAIMEVTANCPQCDAPLRIKRPTGRAPFWGCTSFDSGCRYVRPLDDESGLVSPLAPVSPVATKPIIVIGDDEGTPQQIAFWRSILDSKGHIVLMARAGAGKSYSILKAGELALEKWPHLRVGYCAYNAEIAKELKGRVPRGSEAFTTHALGLRAITAHLGRKPTLESGKVRALLDSIAQPTDLNRGKVDRHLAKACEALVSHCKSYLFWGLPAELDWILERHEVDMAPDAAEPSKGGKPRSVFTNATLKPRVYELVPQLLEMCMDTLGIIDFDDMPWLAVVLGLPLEPFDLLFIDESQDLNKCRQELVFRACPKGRIVPVGDPAQSIYAFTGADVRSMATMTGRLEASARGNQTLPLTFTRRCPKAVVRLAQELVPDIEAMPDALEGEVAHIQQKDFSQLAQSGDMVLCRCNAPLVGAAHQFLRAGKKAILRGKDLSGQIRDMIRGFDTQSIEELGVLLMRYRLAEGERLENAGKSAQVITAHEDRCDTLQVLMEGCATLGQLDAKIEKIFNQKESPDAIVLSSVHGAKGLEAETVYILQPDLMPHPKATKPEDFQQEQNIRYVALTRAMKRLVFVHSDKHEADNPPAERDVFETPELPLDISEPTPPEVDLSCSVTQDWREEVRAALQRVYGLLPFDAPSTLYHALEAAQREVPR